MRKHRHFACMVIVVLTCASNTIESSEYERKTTMVIDEVDVREQDLINDIEEYFIQLYRRDEDYISQLFEGWA